MTGIVRHRRSMLLANTIAGLLLTARAAAQTASQQPPPPTLPSETPARFRVSQDTWDHARRDVISPMRDGARLHTVVLVTKCAKNAPIHLPHTPYSATWRPSHAAASHH